MSWIVHIVLYRVVECRRTKMSEAVITKIVLTFPFLLLAPYIDDEGVDDHARSISRSMSVVDKIRQNPFIPNNPLSCSAWE